MACKSAQRRAWRVARGKVDPRCDYCGERTSETVPEAEPRRATVEDIMPLSMGGRNDASNWALACSACNQAKGPTHITPRRLQKKKVGPATTVSTKRVARITAKSCAADRERKEHVERLARLARLPFSLYAPIPGVPDEAFR